MKIVIAGDFCPTERIKKMVEKKNYHSIFHEIEPIIKSADYAIVNYECPVVLGKYKPIEKCGPNLSSSVNGIEAIRSAGFNIVTLANNHIMDFGDNGLNDTIKTCKELGIKTVGAGENISEASKTLYIKKEHKTLAIINCCEHEFSVACDKKAGANPLNPIHQYYKIEEAKQSADYVLVIVHGGHEHYQLPSQRMIETYHFFIDVGADIVVNHHQHCFSGYEIYKNKPIFYGIGNFCFDNTNKCNTIWNEGLLLNIELGDTTTFEIIPFLQNNHKAGIHILPIDAFEERIKKINSKISDRKELNANLDKFAIAKNTFNDFIFEPYKSNLCKKLYFRHLIPKLFPRSKKTLLENIICCESHRDILEIYLKQLHKQYENY